MMMISMRLWMMLVGAGAVGDFARQIGGSCDDDFMYQVCG